jgi:uncharacterized protein
VRAYHPLASFGTLGELGNSIHYCGNPIIQYTGEKITKEESARRLRKGNVYIFELNERTDIDGKALANKARFINHSCEPNCIVEKTSRTIWIVAGRDISAGEELTYNYGYGPV